METYADRERISTGVNGLDAILDDLRLGDNVVWKVEHLENYRHLARAFAADAVARGRQLVYLRFGSHDPVLEQGDWSECIELDSQLGFEPFATQVHRILRDRGTGVMYVFDCLSDLVTAWATDYMVANFFQITCPYLLSLDTVAYFAIRNRHHSLDTMQRIRRTTQVFLNLYEYRGSRYVQPLKVWQRRSPTMFLPHRETGEGRFDPVVRSQDATDLMNDVVPERAASVSRHLDHWQWLFVQAESMVRNGADAQQKCQMVRHLARHLMGRDERMLELIDRYFGLEDVLAIKRRMVGTGFIGGKSVGMLLAHQILMQADAERWSAVLEHQDSFFIGSNLYYWYLVHNDCWGLFMEHRTLDDPESRSARELRERILQGRFPAPIRQEFESMLEYFGQYPIILRSSSLLEDGYGNAFAGKYDSYFLANQEISPEERLEHFENIVRRIYASTIGGDALVYRRQRGLMEQDEQMALLVQRVLGAYRGHYYLPDVAGVGVSYNTYVWDSAMDPHAGMLRLVVGLGTRAVDRAEGDYARLVALDYPQKTPYRLGEETRRFAQKDIDVLDLNANEPRTVSLQQLAQSELADIMPAVALHERIAAAGRDRLSRPRTNWVPTFEPLFENTDFVRDISDVLQTLENAYAYPVDIEFTLNFDPSRGWRLGIVQCRPLQTRESGTRVDIPGQIPDERVFLEQRGNFLGGNIDMSIQRIIAVMPQAYHELNQVARHEVANIIGRLNAQMDREPRPCLLLGPGRWGTSTPALGVPVSFAQISQMAVLGEVAWSRGGFVPELSFGTHFFQDLVESGIFYLGVFPSQADTRFRDQWLEQMPNRLTHILEDAEAWSDVIKVLDFDVPLRLLADLGTQRLLCLQP